VISFFNKGKSISLGLPFLHFCRFKIYVTDINSIRVAVLTQAITTFEIVKFRSKDKVDHLFHSNYPTLNATK